MTTLRELVEVAEAGVAASSDVELWRPWVARVDAEDLMRTALRRDFTDADLDAVATGPLVRRFRALLKRREAGEPMALIRGHIDFAGLRLAARPGVFTPRFSSELLAAEAIARISRRRTPVAVDVACGAGAVALAMAHRLPRATVVGLDIAPAAAALGRYNASQLGLANATFAAGDLLAPLSKKYLGVVDVFTIHPPYIARDLVATLPREVREFEPPESLTDQSDDGLGLVRRLATEGQPWLKPGGWVLVEVSTDLARPVRAILGRHGFTDLKSIRDRLNVSRVVAGRLGQASP